jgi:predicted CoA-substrate-specific enzyme activase
MNKENGKTIEKAYGICLGASTISAVEVIRDKDGIKTGKIITKSHEGMPKAEFENILKELHTEDNPVLITGRRFRKFIKLPSITETEAMEYALEQVCGKGEKYDALVSAGGETFIVYRLDEKHRVCGISTGNKCASGTGEFFMQQIKRMGLTIDQAVDAADTGTPYPVSGRCSVFCKSDCTHALNKGEPINDVTAGLCRMIALKIVELVSKIPHTNVLVVGGTARNRVVIKHLKEYEPNIHVPKEAAYFEALGAAIAAFDKGKANTGTTLFTEEKSSFSFLAPLKSAEHLVTFNKMEYAKAHDKDKCIVGLDVGSTTTKAVLLRVKDDKFLASVYLRTNGNPVEASRQCFKAILDKLDGTEVEITGIGVTGSGRHIAGLYALTEGIINEIIAHASASAFFDPGVDTIFEIGGQDAKYTHLVNSVASDYAMNEACSAGTGSFLEESAIESFGVKAEEIAALAIKGDMPPNFNDQCAAFISSDIKNALHEGISKENILAGLVYSICLNYMNRVKGHRQVGEKVFMQGGVCYNKAVPLAMAYLLQKPIIVPPEPGLMGAFGVALELKKRIDLGLIHENKFDLKQLIHRQVANEKPFICPGGKEKCDLKCSISRIKIEDKLYPFGGACNKYYNMNYRVDFDAEELDLVKVRTGLMFNKYAPVHHVPEKSPKIGINKSLSTHTIFPLYYNFFVNLGCHVIVPDQFNEKALNRQTTSFCYPAQLAIGLFDNLSDKQVDYYFMPHVRELYVPKGNQKKDFSATCIFSQGEGFWMAQLFKDKKVKDKILDPTLNFRKGWASEKLEFIKIGKKLGFGKKETEAAFDKAVSVQDDFEKECREIGKKALEELRKHPERFATVLLGRPHNAFTDDANKGIPKKVATRGHLIIPYDMLDLENEKLNKPFDESMHWEIGQHLLRAAQVIKKDKQLFGIYITNFLCAIDSFLTQHVRRVMGTKPSLTLELDGHTADAGVNTRIDAFLDVVNNYLQVNDKEKHKKADTFIASKIIGENGRLVFSDSQGVKTPLTDPSITILVPAMGDLGNQTLAAALRKSGINAYALPIPDEETRMLGRSVLTGKECVPLVMCLGSFLKYIKYDRRPGEKVGLFIPKAHGYCRLGQYFITVEHLCKDKHIPDAAPFYFAQEVGYTGLGADFSMAAWKGLVISDVMDDIRNAIYALAVDVDPALQLFYSEYEKIMDNIAGKSKQDLYKLLASTAAKLKKIELTKPMKEAPQVVINGEIFVRRDSFSNNRIARMLAERGFIARHASVSEWIFYNNYLIKKGIWKPEHSFKDWVEFYISDAFQLTTERKIKNALAKSGLYEKEIINVGDFDRYSDHLIPNRLTGEPGLSVGKMLKDGLTQCAGFINIGPFGCMITRFTEAVAQANLEVSDKKEAFKQAGTRYNPGEFDDNDRIPFLTIEVDGNPYPQLLMAKFESFCLQAARVADKQGKKAEPHTRPEKLFAAMTPGKK